MSDKELPRDHPEYFGVKMADKFVPAFTPDEPWDWASKFRSTMDFGDLLRITEDMAIGVKERHADFEDRLSWAETTLRDMEGTAILDNVESDVEDLKDKVFNHGATIRSLEGAVGKLQESNSGDVLQELVTTMVDQLTAKYEQQVADLKVELKEAFDLIESLEDVIDNVA